MPRPIESQLEANSRGEWLLFASGAKTAKELQRRDGFKHSRSDYKANMDDTDKRTMEVRKCASFRIRCCGELHAVTVYDAGRIRFHNHKRGDLKTLSALNKMSESERGCQLVVDMLKSSDGPRPKTEILAICKRSWQRKFARARMRNASGAPALKTVREAREWLSGDFMRTRERLRLDAFDISGAIIERLLAPGKKSKPLFVVKDSGGFLNYDDVDYLDNFGDGLRIAHPKGVEVALPRVGIGRPPGYGHSVGPERYAHAETIRLISPYSSRSVVTKTFIQITVGYLWHLLIKRRLAVFNGALVLHENEDGSLLLAAPDNEGEMCSWRTGPKAQGPWSLRMDPKLNNVRADQMEWGGRSERLD